MSKVTKNIIYNFLGQGILLILGFVAVKYIFNQLGDEALGIIYFALMMSSILTAILELGIASSTVREISTHWQEDPEYTHQFIRTASLFYWSSYIIFSLIIYFIAPFIVEHWIHIKNIDAKTTVLILRIVGIAAFTSLPRVLYASIFRGLERMEFNNVIDVVMNILQQLGIILIIFFGGKVLPVVSWVAVSFFLGIIIYIFILSKYFFSLKTFIPQYFSSVVKRNLNFASRMASISMLSVIQTQADKLIISKLLPISFVGYYSVVYTGLARTSIIADSVSQAVFPSFSSLFKKNNHLDLDSQYWKLQDFISIFTIPLFALMPFIAIPFFGYIFNAEIAQQLFLPFIFLSAGFYMHSTVVIPYFFSLAVGKPGITAKMNFYALFIILPVTIALIYFFGLAGAGFSWVFYHLFVYVYGIRRICRECLHIVPKEWYLHIIKIVFPAIIIYGIVWFGTQLFNLKSIIYLLFSYFFASIIFAFGAYKLMRKELKSVIGRYIQKLR